MCASLDPRPHARDLLHHCSIGWDLQCALMSSESQMEVDLLAARTEPRGKSVHAFQLGASL